MRRRAFIAGLGVAASWLCAARAQQSIPTIGFLSGRSRAESEALLKQFRKGLAEAGFAEGRNVRIEYRWAEGRYDRLPALAAELIDLRATLIVATSGNVTSLAAKAATSTVPIVFLQGGDPVKTGLVASFNRPGGNVTGVSLFISELAGKRLELLREVAPKAMIIGILANPNNPSAVSEARDVEVRAASLGLGAQLLHVRGADDLEPAFATAASAKVDAILVANDPFLIDIKDQLVRIAAARAIPVVYFTRDFVEAGGLVSYGASIGDGYHKVGTYAGQILMGAKPADLPVQQPTKFELVINLKTAKALGIEPSLSLQARADEVIE
jgi:putative ABC transport system substrate-binding protein